MSDTRALLTISAQCGWAALVRFAVEKVPVGQLPEIYQEVGRARSPMPGTNESLAIIQAAIDREKLSQVALDIPRDSGIAGVPTRKM